MNKTRYALLGMLNDAPRTGYMLKQDIETTVGHFWGESYGQIYPILKQLVAEGLATVSISDGKPLRKVYAITDAGRSELRRWLVEPIASAQPSRNELLLKLFFGAEVSKEALKGHLVRQREAADAALATFAGIKDALQAYEQDPNLPYWLATLRYGERVQEAVRGWADETLDALDAPPSGASPRRYS